MNAVSMTVLQGLVAATLLSVDAPAAAARTPRATVEALFAAFYRHDVVAMTHLYALDARLTSSDFCAARGRSDVARTYRALFDAWPDLHDDVEAIVASGDRVAMRFVARSEAGGFSLRIATFVRVRGGLIVEDDSFFDTGGRPCTP